MKEQPSAKQVIRAAIAAAGGGVTVAQKLGLGSSTPGLWVNRGSIPAERIKPVCDLGGNVVNPMQILEAMTRESTARAGT